ncbi:MAG: tetratricopeptide repeat protein [Nitrospirae bacterium]|nr:tetratricopeptide repeat protein [Candidatus Manganitrophaceae bacterium]
MFPFSAGLMLMAVTLVLLYPLWRRSRAALIVGDEAALDEERVDLQIEKESLMHTLSDLEIDFARSKMAAAEYGRLKLGHEHRLAQVLDRLDALSGIGLVPPKLKKSKPVSGGPGPLWIGVLGVAVVAGAVGMHQLVQWKLERQQVAAAGEAAAGMPPVNPVEMVARLEERLKKNPNDLQGQLMAGRSYMALERWPDAEKAWRKAVELDERSHAAHYGLAEVLIRTADPNNREVYQEALSHLDKALINVPQDASILWAKGVVLVHLERYQEADEVWTEAYKYIPPGTESADFVKQALQSLRSGRAPLF